MSDKKPVQQRSRLVVTHGERRFAVPIYDQLFVGRECAGIGETRRLVIDQPDISRTHLEIRLDTAADAAFVIDTSTNGTLLNGARLDRAVPVPLRPGDEIRIGDIRMTFESSWFRAAVVNRNLTRARISEADMVMVVGDITNYSTMSQVTDSKVIAESLYRLWDDLAGMLRDHHGSLNHYAGDAIYAVWDLQALPQPNELAIDFALAANCRVEEIGPSLALRSPDGEPIHMGWGIVQGHAALAPMTRVVESVIGDSTNLAFRLAGLAGRNGRAPVVVTTAVHAAVEPQFQWGSPEKVETKGRRGLETVYPVLGRRAVTGAQTVPSLVH